MKTHSHPTSLRMSKAFQQARLTTIRQNHTVRQTYTLLLRGRDNKKLFRLTNVLKTFDLEEAYFYVFFKSWKKI